MRNTQDIGILLLRLVSGGFMLFSHGLGKASKLFAGGVIKFPDPIGIGALPSLVMASITEVILAALIMIGLKTRLSSIPLAITMFVAAFIVHGSDPFKKQEFALLYMAIYIALCFLGPGKYSIDYFSKNRR